MPKRLPGTEAMISPALCVWPSQRRRGSCFTVIPAGEDDKSGYPDKGVLEQLADLGVWQCGGRTRRCLFRPFCQIGWSGTSSPGQSIPRKSRITRLASRAVVPL